MNTAKPFIDTSDSSFRSLRERGSYLVDKSLFIRDLIDAEKSIVVPRPRRFGKTTNLLMALEFFRIDKQDQAELFKGMKILNDPVALEHMGKHPVIFLDLKSWQPPDLDDLGDRLALTMSSALTTHKTALLALEPEEQDQMKSVLACQANRAVLQKSLALLCKALALHHQAEPIILIDEYDAPIHSAYAEGFYDEAIKLLRPWLSDALKTNNYLFKGCLTGILRISKESLFSGLNNIEAYTLLNRDQRRFQDKFGFTEDEVAEILRVFGKEDSLVECRRWYNGYVFGQHTIYNPWSITHFARSELNEPRPWWVNTSKDALIWQQLAIGHPRDRQEMQMLLAGGSVRKAVSEATHLSQLPNSEALWSLIVLSGYLKASEPITEEDTGTTYKLELPNREVFEAFRNFVNDGFSQLNLRTEDLPFQLLAEDRLEELEESLRELFLACASYHDLNRIAESFVQGVFFGICIHLRKSFLIRSNVETGRGRADILLTPRDPTSGLSGKILEIKIAKDNESLEQGLAAAFAQIDKRDYATSLREAGCNKILKIAIAVKGKDIAIGFQTTQVPV